MTLLTLLIYFAIAGAVLTALTWKIQKNRLLAFLQYFSGVWFVFSGVVKAVDPWGTAFKMQQYFSEFKSTFSATPLKPIVPLLTWMSDNALGFSIFMIVLEILIGVLLILGHRTAFTTWTMLLIMVFFTALTGYTHLTGYVPDGVNFFEFGKWGEWVETNMKVTDCGCFGDFLKLQPTTSFYKDLLILMPINIFFVFKHKSFVPLFSSLVRKVTAWVTVILATVFCFRNAFFDEPVVDFRPFKNGVNIRLQKEAEEKAQAEIKILTWKVKNEKTGEVLELTDEVYMKNFESTYSKENGWAIVGQTKTEPKVPHSKISDFALNDKDGAEIQDSLLREPNYLFLVASWKMLSTETRKTIQVPDSIFTVDSVKGTRTLERVDMKEEVFKSFTFDPEYRWSFTSKINPFFEKAEKAGYKIAGLVPFSDPKKIQDFRHDVQAAYPFYTADELVIKTMIRSNPGVYLLKNGLIVHKWHINQLPEFEKVQAEYMK
ncbi:MAG: hypothetical protein JNL70_06610 [Saprospiraceae bacterium]|nr:hypothetical protein [Saprospiraceae bacterium]